jgi:hypothetical protein
VHSHAFNVGCPAGWPDSGVSGSSNLELRFKPHLRTRLAVLDRVVMAACPRSVFGQGSTNACHGLSQERTPQRAASYPAKYGLMVRTSRCLPPRKSIGLTRRGPLRASLALSRTTPSAPCS